MKKVELMEQMKGMSVEGMEAFIETLKGNPKGLAKKVMKEILAEREQEDAAGNDLMDMLNETADAENIADAADQQEEQQEEKEADTMKEIPAGKLGKLKALQEEVKALGKGQKVNLVTAVNLSIKVQFEQEGIYAMVGNNGEEKEYKLYYNRFDLETIHAAENVKDYSEGYKAIKKAFRGGDGKELLRRYRQTVKGEMILISCNAEQGGGKYKLVGKTALFIKPNAGQTITINVKDENGNKGTHDITAENWDLEPLALFSDGGRATKMAHFLAYYYDLNADFERDATEKYKTEIRHKILSKNWLLLTMENDKMAGFTKNSNIRQLKNGIEKGWASVIEELTNII